HDRLLPERQRPGEPAAGVHHLLVTAPRVVDEDVQPSLIPRDAIEGGADRPIVRVIAGQSNDRGRKRGLVDRTAGRVDDGPGVGERGSDPTADAAARAGDEGNLSLNTELSHG